MSRLGHSKNTKACRRAGPLNPPPADMTVTVLNTTPWRSADLQALFTQVRRLAYAADLKTLPLPHNQTRNVGGAVRFVERVRPKWQDHKTGVDSEEGVFGDQVCVHIEIPPLALMDIAPMQVVTETAEMPPAIVRRVIRAYARVIREGSFQASLQDYCPVIRLAPYDERAVQARQASEWCVSHDLAVRLRSAAEWTQHVLEEVEDSLRLIDTIGADADLTPCEKDRSLLLDNVHTLQGLTEKLRAATQR